MPAIKIKINPLNHIETKKTLLDKNLTVSGMARELAAESDARFNSVRTALDELLYGRRFHPALAQKVETKFGLKIERLPNFQPVRKRLSQAA